MKRLTKCLCYSIGMSLMSYGSMVLATPQAVILIPHAEKQSNGPDLTKQGRRTARFYAHAITRDAAITPNAIIANSTVDQRALGSIQTCQPLARKLKLKVDSEYQESDYQTMVHKVLSAQSYNGKVVAICWDVHNFPQILKDFGVTQPVAALHPKQIYQLRFAAPGTGAAAVSADVVTLKRETGSR